MKRMNYHYAAFDPLADVSSFYDDHPHFLVGIMSFSDDHIIVLEDSFLLRNKPLRWIMSLAILVLGGFINLLAYFRKSDRELLAVSNLVSDQSHDGVVITDTLDHVTYCNKTFELLSGFSAEEVRTGSHTVKTLSGERFDAEQTIRDLRAKESSISSWKGFVWIEGKRHVALTHLSVSTVSNNHGHIAHHVGLYSNPRNLSREPYENLLIEKESRADDFDSYPVRLLENKRKEDVQFVLIYMKLVNIDLIEAQYSLDEHYLLGAQIRERIARVLDRNDLIIQYSPDTFLLTRHIANPSIMRELEGLERMFTKSLGLRERQQVIHARMGVSSLGSSCDDAATMLRQGRMALAALDHFEREGMLRYDKSVDEHLIRYHAILQAFPDAAAQRTLQSSTSRWWRWASTASYRRSRVWWTHPLLVRSRPPSSFPIVEQNNLRGCSASSWCRRDRFSRCLIRGSGISVSMNPVSHECRTRPGRHMVRGTTRRTLTIRDSTNELTERTLLTGHEGCQLGSRYSATEHIKVAIDDFGTGFSSRSYLHEVHVTS